MPAMHATAMQQKSSKAGIAAPNAPRRIMVGRIRAEGTRNSPICSEAGNGKSVATEVIPIGWKADLIVTYAFICGDKAINNTATNNPRTRSLGRELKPNGD